MRALFMCIAAVLAAVAADEALAATRTATDDKAGVKFRIQGHLLSATILPNTGAIISDTAQELQGRRVTAVCGTNLTTGRGRTTHRPRRWPRGRATLKFWLPRDVSAHARWCVLETGRTGADVAGVIFKRRR